MALNKLPSLDKSRSSSKTEIENTLKLDTKNKPLSLARSDEKYGRTTIKSNKNKNK